MWWCGKKFAAKLIRNPVIYEAKSSNRRPAARAASRRRVCGPLAQSRTAPRSDLESAGASAQSHASVRLYPGDTAGPFTGLIYLKYRNNRLGGPGTLVRRLIKIKS